MSRYCGWKIPEKFLVEGDSTDPTMETNTVGDVGGLRAIGGAKPPPKQSFGAGTSPGLALSMSIIKIVDWGNLLATLQVGDWRSHYLVPLFWQKGYTV